MTYPQFFLSTLNMFLPHSAEWEGGDLEKESITLKSAEIFFSELNKMAGVSTKIFNINKINLSESEQNFCDALSNKLNYYGSDKVSGHGYEKFYARILYQFLYRNGAKILEIGLGTNNTDVPSNMGKCGKPGASVRAFRDVMVNANIFGADIDKRILFTEDRISTFEVDQLDSDSILSLGRNVGYNIDLLIDDGLHSPGANLNVIAHMLKNVSSSGFVVVEDIPERSLELWFLVSSLLCDAGYNCGIYSARNDYIFAVTRGLLV